MLLDAINDLRLLRWAAEAFLLAEVPQDTDREAGQLQYKCRDILDSIQSSKGLVQIAIANSAVQPY